MLLSLRKITVENFRGVRGRLTLDFTDTPPGLYFVRGVNREGARLGSNGAGKSSLFSVATIWALTGQTDRSKRPSSEVENRRAGGTTRVAIELSLDGAAHVVERTRSPNNLTLDGGKVDQREVDALLPLTDAALRKSVLIDQFSERFLDLRPEAQSQLFTETLDLDHWLRAAELASARADDAGRRGQDTSRKLDSVKAALAEVRDQLEAAVTVEEKFDAELKVLVDTSKKRGAAAKTTAADARRALNAARARPAAAGDDNRERALNDARTRLRERARAGRDAARLLEQAEAAYADAERSMKRYTGEVMTCPECGQEVDRAHVEEKRTVLERAFAEIKRSAKERLEVSEAIDDEVKRLEEDIARQEKALSQYHEALAVVAAAAERSLAADREMRRCAEELAELEARANPFGDVCDDLERRIDQLAAQRDELKEEEMRLGEQLAIGQFWARGFREIRLRQIDQALAELELATNRHAEALGLDDWRVAFATDRETKRGTVSLGFTVALYPPDAPDAPVGWDSYCGGEVQRWQLAATFGLAEVLLARAGVSTDFEILDEPTQHLSPEGIDDLMVCLSDRARELNRRIFLIDHNSLDRGAFDGVVTVAKDAERGTYVEDDGGVLSVARARRERVLL